MDGLSMGGAWEMESVFARQLAPIVMREVCATTETKCSACSTRTLNQRPGDLCHACQRGIMERQQ